MDNNLTCRYCCKDGKGYIKPIDRGSHVYLYSVKGVWKLMVHVYDYRKECSIKYCPMCGRELNNNERD